MAEPKIELRKIRDFGTNLSDTFEFIRQNLKPLLAGFFAISGIFILLQAITSGVFESNVFSGLHRISDASNFERLANNNHFYSHYASLPFLFYLLSAWLAYVAMQVCIGAYMKYYDLHDGAKPVVEEVWQIFKQYYLKVLFYVVPIMFMVVLGLVFCILPGLYLGVVFVPFVWVVMLEDVSLGTGIQRCFEIIKENFWISLGIYFVTTLIYSFASGIIGMMVGAISGILAYLTTRDLASTIGIATSILRVFGFVFYIIFLVSSLLHYYNLVERRDAIGLMRRIDQVGTSTDSDPDLPEQF